MSSTCYLTQPDFPPELAERLQQQYGLHATESPQGWYLCWTGEALVLRNTELNKQGDILVDFASGAATHRRKYGGGKSEAIAKAVGLRFNSSGCHSRFRP